MWSENPVEAAYARSDLFERRRVLMGDWARYLAQGSVQDGSTTSTSGGSSRCRRRGETATA